MSQQPLLVLESQGGPREQSVFSPHWNPEEVIPITSKGKNASATGSMNLPLRGLEGTAQIYRGSKIQV